MPDLCALTAGLAVLSSLLEQVRGQAADTAGAHGGEGRWILKELQLVEYDNLKADRLIEREMQRLQREAERTEHMKLPNHRHP